MTTSKTKQFCETSAIFEVDNIKNETTLRDFLQKWKVECRADGLVPMRFVFFPLPLSKVLRPPRKKVMPGHTKCCTCHAKSSSQNWRSDAPKCNPSQERTWWTCLLYCACHGKCILFKFPRLPPFLQMLQLLTFDNVHNPLRMPRKTISERPKVLRTPQFFCTFDFEMCLAHLRTTTACTFSTSQLPKVFRTRGALSILTWTCASRHNGVQLFISPLTTWLRTRHFSEPTFRPSGASKYWKNTVFRDFPTFSRTWIFLTFSFLIFLLLFSSLTLPISAFHLSILSEVWLLNFLRLDDGQECKAAWQSYKRRLWRRCQKGLLRRRKRDKIVQNLCHSKSTLLKT